MSKFTKGTWKYLEALYQVTAYPDGGKAWPVDERGWPVYPKGGWWQDITGELSGCSEEEIHANGRLIAAAPRMYRLLDDAMCILRRLDYGDPLAAEIEQLLACIDGEEARA